MITIPSMIPEETKIYFSRGSAWVGIFFSFLFCGFAVWLIMMLHLYWAAAAFVVFGSWSAWENLKGLRDRTPKIIINDKGIETVNTPFHPWSEITDDRVTLTGSGTKVASTKLSYNYPGGSEKLDIGTYDIRQHELERLLQIYRERSVKSITVN